MLAFAWMRYDCEWHAKHWSKKISLDILIRGVRDDGPILDIGIEGGIIVRLEERIDDSSRQLIEAGGRVREHRIPAIRTRGCGRISRPACPTVCFYSKF